MTAPIKLVRLYAQHGSYHKVAQERGVNVYWVYQLLKHGKEPTNPKIRQALYLPKSRRAKAGTVKTEPTPAHWNWWRHLPKDYRDKLVWSEYQSSLEHGE